VVAIIDIKLDNILIGNSSYYMEDLFNQFLEANPPEIIGETTLQGKAYPQYKCQPIPNRFVWNTSAFEAELMSVYLCDLGHGACKMERKGCCCLFVCI